MELWIRSQDKAILKKVPVGLLIKTDIENNNKENKYYIVSGSDELGTYKTKERALEVLDEIQKVIMPKYIISNFPNDKVKNLNQTFKYNYDYIQSDGNINIRELGNYVYEMPKE